MDMATAIWAAADAAITTAGAEATIAAGADRQRTAILEAAAWRPLSFQRFDFPLNVGLAESNAPALQPAGSRKSTDCAGLELSMQYNFRWDGDSTSDCNPTGPARPYRGSSMPLFSFRTLNAGRASASDACELEDHDEAWKELTRVCSDLIAGYCRSLKQNSEWSMEVRDAADAPLFRIRLVAETQVGRPSSVSSASFPAKPPT